MMMGRAIGLAGNIGECDQKVEDGLKKLRHEIAHANYQRLGWDDHDSDDPNTKLLRATMIGLMLGSEDADTIKHAVDVFNDAKHVEDIPSDRRGSVLGTIVRHRGDSKAIDDLIDLYKTTPNADLQHSLCGALTYTKDPELAKRFFDEGFAEGGYVRPQDSFRWYAYLMRNKYTRDVAWDWLTNNWDYVETIGKKSIDHWVVYSAGPLQTPEWEKKFHDFYEPKKNIQAITRNIDIAYAEIAARVAWRTRELDNLKQFLEK